MAIKKIIPKALLAFRLVVDLLSERLFHVAAHLEAPPFLKEEMNITRLMKKIKVPRNTGRRPGAEGQPPGLGILKDHRMTPRLKAMRTRELMKSIPAIESFLVSVWRSGWLSIFFFGSPNFSIAKVQKLPFDKLRVNGF